MINNRLPDRSGDVEKGLDRRRIEIRGRKLLECGPRQSDPGSMARPFLVNRTRKTRVTRRVLDQVANAVVSIHQQRFDYVEERRAGHH